MKTFSLLKNLGKKGKNWQMATQSLIEIKLDELC